MRDILYDFKRTFTGKYTIVASLIIILVAVGVAFLATSSGIVPRPGRSLAQRSFTEFGSFSGALIPILASLSSYFYYGKDKANDVLESVITLPVTRARLIISRFVANVGSLLLAFAVGVLFYELILYELAGTYLSAYYVSYLVWVYLVEIAAFTGLVYLASQFLKSQGGILGLVVALSLVFGLFWENDIIVLILYAANIPIASTLYIQYRLILEAISPAGYSIFSVFLIVPTNSDGTLLNASQFGVTSFSVALLGLGWMLLPISLAVYIGRRRD